MDSTDPWLTYDWNTGYLFALTESLPVKKRRQEPDGTYLEGGSSIGVVSVVPWIFGYDQINLAACDAYVRKIVASREDTETTGDSEGH